MNSEPRKDLGLELDPQAADTARMLDEIAAGIQPDPAFAARLQTRLVKSHPGMENSSMFSIRKLAPALLWTLVAVATVFVLQWLVRSLAPQPVPAAQKTPTASAQKPAPSGEAPTGVPTKVPEGSAYRWQGATLYLAAALPEVPAAPGVYIAQPAPHVTVEEAVALAQRFGIQGTVYKTPGELPDSIDYLVTDGRQILRVRSANYFEYTANATDSFNFLGAVQRPDAEAIIDAFLQGHGFTFAHRIEWSDYRSGYMVEPLSAEGLPLRHEHFAPPMLLVMLDQEGHVAMFRTSLLEPTEQAPGQFEIISAEEALQRMVQEGPVNGIVASMNGAPHPLQQWFRHQAAQQDTRIYGTIFAYPAVDPSQPPFIQLDGYTLSGNLQGLDQLPQNTYVSATGHFVDESLDEFGVDSWKRSDVPEDGLVGTISMQGDRAIITMQDGSGSYVLPDIPQDLPLPFENAFVVGTRAGDSFEWKMIDNRMALGGGGGGGGGGSGFYKLNLSGTPVAFPTATPAPTQLPAGITEYSVQAGDTWQSIATAFGISADEVLQANGMNSPGSLVAGQTIVVPSTTGVLQGMRGIITVAITRWPDGSAKKTYSFMPLVPNQIARYMLLQGTDLSSLDAYHNRPIDIWATVTLRPDGSIPTARLDRYEVPFPDLKVQVLDGKQKLTEISGQPATLFTSNDGDTYVQLFADGTVGSSLIGNEGDEVLVEGLSIPGESRGGYPALRIFGGMPAIDPSTGLHVNLPQTADQPIVVDARPGSIDDMPTATVERIELIEFSSDMRYEPDPQPQQAVYFQPVWLFSGHYSNGDEFEVLVQALRQEYLLPEVETTLTPG